MSVRAPLFGAGGYDPDAPYNNKIQWHDDDARVVWTTTPDDNGVATAHTAVSTPYGPDDNAFADSRDARQDALNAAALLAQDASGLVDTVTHVGVVQASDQTAASTARTAIQADAVKAAQAVTASTSEATLATTNAATARGDATVLAAAQQTMAALTAKGGALALTDLPSIVAVLSSLMQWRVWVDARVLEVTTGRVTAAQFVADLATWRTFTDATLTDLQTARVLAGASLGTLADNLSTVAQVATTDTNSQLPQAF